ncbi:hypothetical protein [Arthrobacter sp. OAP107]|uniref:hypothetical protein n=1 Tax=Arthrobacter sp. OAP107 TaxID=3156445 RepID=UPI0033950BD5
MIHQSEAPVVEAQVSAYLEDTYLEQTQTRVLAVGQQDGVAWAAVEQCLFHPQGGGQPADRGWLEDMEIVPVRDRESGLIVAMGAGGTSVSGFAAGQPVQARIDLQARLAHAALHTAGHLVEAVGRMQGWEMVSNNHFPGQARIEFQLPETEARLADPQGREEVTAALQASVDRAIAEDLPVSTRYEGEGLRIVHLHELHAAPCGGTHVRSLGDLTNVILPALKVKKGRIRVSYIAAHRSL